MKKKTIIAFSAIIVISVIAFFAYDAKATFAPAPAAVSSSANLLNTGLKSAAENPSAPALRETTLVDHKASVFQVVGNAKLLKMNTDHWRTLRVGMTIEAGDQIRTSKDGLVRINYDDYYLNIVQINKDSLAEFQAIEPTQIYITNGEVFSVLDGLPKGSSYQVVTPTAVGGVRGTRFLRAFNPVTQQDKTMVSEGTVELTLLNKEYNSKSFRITDQQSLIFDEHTMSDLSQASPRPLAQKFAGDLNQDFLDIKSALSEAKGDDELMQAAQMWQEIQGNHNKVILLKNELKTAGISQNMTPEGVIVFGAMTGSSGSAEKKEEKADETVHVGSNTGLNVTPEGALVGMLTGDVESANSVANLDNTMLTSEVDICKQNPSACGK